MDNISKFRKEIMGIAISLIIICHTTIYIEHARLLQIYNLIRQFSKIGVDIFFMLSGLGLYFSFSNDHHILRFYKKRMFRIIPQYVIVVICWGIVAIGLSLESICGFVWKYSLISFYVTGELATWFVAAIMLLYLLFPLFYGVLQKGRTYLYELCILLYCISFCVTLSFSEGTPLRLINEALEIYLIHEKLLLVYDTYIPKSTMGSILSNFAAVILAVLLSKSLSNVVGNLRCKVHKEG